MRYQLILADVDSTLIENEVIDLLAEYTERPERIISITDRAMRGELDFETALRERVRCLADLSEEILSEVAKKVQLSPGAMELKDFAFQNGIKFGAVTGGFIQVLEKLPFFTDLDLLKANTLEIEEGKLTGEVIGEIVDRAEKARQLKSFAAREAINIDSTVAIGDGANDLEMIEVAGLGVAYRGKEIMREHADLLIEDSLAELIPYLMRSMS